MNPHAVYRNTVVIGASYDGVGALGKLVAALPEDLAAAVFVVQHRVHVRNIRRFIIPGALNAVLQD